MWWGGVGKKLKKICRGVDEKKMYRRGSAKKIKYVRGVGEKIKIFEGGSAKFSIPPPHQDFKWNSPNVNQSPFCKPVKVTNQGKFCVLDPIVRAAGKIYLTHHGQKV